MNISGTSNVKSGNNLKLFSQKRGKETYKQNSWLDLTNTAKNLITAAGIYKMNKLTGLKETPAFPVSELKAAATSAEGFL